MPEEDKKEARAAKFGILTEKSVEDKKAARAAKFAAEKKEATDDKAAVSICYLYMLLAVCIICRHSPPPPPL